MGTQGQRKRYAVIGAGASGLVALKSCLEDGNEAVCFERAENVGGVWNYVDGPETRRCTVMKCTITNSSKLMYTYSDFPMSKDWPLYLRHGQVLQYFNMYAEHFDLLKHIRFSTDVVMVKRAADYTETGRWVVHIRQTADGTEQEEQLIVDGVLVATGFLSKKFVPDIPGSETFQGTVLHTKDYRDSTGFEGKKVIVIGVGNSGTDVSTDVSRVAKQVYLSTRQGAWVYSRLGPSGRPFDCCLLTRHWNFLSGSILPRSVSCSITEKDLNNHFDHLNFGLKPTHRADSQLPVLTEELPSRISCGSVRMKPGIQRISTNGVEFTDGSKLEDIDVIVYATGHQHDYSIIEKGVMDIENEGLYKLILPPRLEHPTLAIIGCGTFVGPIIPIAEMQCRWAVQVMTGACTLPPVNEKLASIKAQRKAMGDTTPPTRPYRATLYPYIPIMDELAEMIGCKPSFTKLWLTDPRLAWKCYFGPCSAAQYRLQGPYPWEGARGAIFEIDENIKSALKTRVPE